MRCAQPPAAATCLAVNSSNSRLPAPWQRARNSWFLDEPTEGIQPSIIKDIGRVIRQLAKRGDMAILLVEQYYDFARELADQYVVMERGAVRAQGLGADMERDGVREMVAI
jgi:ABC-type branched-subunit amino acid transport system ATPase component